MFLIKKLVDSFALNLSFWKISKPFVLWFCMLLLPWQSTADNGAVAYAYPISDISVNGDLLDWPAELPAFSIDRHYAGRPFSKSAFFKVAYNVQTQSLYIAVVVPDQSYISVDGDEDWLVQDSHLLYLDTDHIANGSGPWLFTGMAQGISVRQKEGTFDPKMSHFNEADIEFAVANKHNETIYEWKIYLPNKIKPNVSFGLDHIIHDRDKGDTGSYGGLVMWGEFSGKVQRAARLGDVLLIDPKQAKGTLRGTVAWAKDVNTDLDIGQGRVKISSLDEPSFWTQIPAKQGIYEIELPVGKYKISSPFDLYGRQDEIRLRDNLHVVAEVKQDKVNHAPLFELSTISPPVFTQGRGLLFDKTLTDSTLTDMTLVDDFITSYMHYYRIPGASFAMVKNGKIVYQQHYGVKNAYTQTPVDDETLFDVGSVTKIFAAFAAHRLVERGLLDLDKPLHEYLPFPEIEHDHRYKLITARHVLSHQTGFPNWGYDNPDGKISINFIPGTAFGYSGAGFDYLGRVLEAVTQQTLEQVLLQESQNVLGVPNAAQFRKSEEWLSSFANGHDLMRPYESQAPEKAHAAYGMHTTASNLAKVMISLMKHKGLSEQSYEQILTPVTRANVSENNDVEQKYFSLGFQVTPNKYGTAIGHSGENWGNLSLFEYYPEHQAGFVILTNSKAGAKVYDALRQYLTQPHVK